MTSVRFALLSLLLFSSACIVISEEPANTTSTDIDGGADDNDVTGRLVRGADLQQAAAGREVKLAGPSTAATTTDADGNFSFENVSAGSYELRSELVDQDGKSHDVLITDLVVVDATVDLGALPLPGGIAGTAELTGASTHAGIDVYKPGSEFLVTTDDSGHYLLLGFEHGSHTLRFSKADYNEAQLEGIEVISGEITSADPVTLTKDVATGSSLSGTIALLGAPDNSGVTVSIDGTEHTTTTNAAGEFAITDIASGSYTVSIDGPAGWMSIDLPNLPLQPGNPVSIPTLDLGRGRVVDKGPLLSVSPGGDYVAVLDDMIKRITNVDSAATFFAAGELDPLYFGDTVAYVVDEFSSNIRRYDLATAVGVDVFTGDAQMFSQTSVRNDGFFFRKSSGDWSIEYYGITDSNSATLVTTSTIGGVFYVTPDATKMFLPTAQYITTSTPLNTFTFSVMPVSGETMTEVGQLGDLQVVEETNAYAWFLDFHTNSIVSVDFASYATATVIDELNLFDLAQVSIDTASYPIAYSKESGLLAYIGNGGLYAADISDGTHYLVNSLNEIPYDCEPMCMVGLFNQGNTAALAYVDSSYRPYNYYADVTGPSPLTGSPENQTVPLSNGGSYEVSASEISYQPSGVPSASLIAPISSERPPHLVGDRLIYSMPVLVDLASPVYNLNENYIMVFDPE